MRGRCHDIEHLSTMLTAQRKIKAASLSYLRQYADELNPEQRGTATLPSKEFLRNRNI